MRNLGPGKEVLFMWKPFWWPSKADYLVKDIKSYKKVSTIKKGSKDLVFYSEGWENFNKYEWWILGSAAIRHKLFSFKTPWFLTRHILLSDIAVNKVNCAPSFLLSVCLGSAYFAEIENFLLKVL